MYSWYLKQKLLVKLVIPSVVIVALLCAGGALMVYRVLAQQTMQTALQNEAALAQSLAQIAQQLSLTQTSVYKSVSLAFGGLDPEKAGADLHKNIGQKASLDSTLTHLARQSSTTTNRAIFDTIQQNMKNYYSWVKNVEENLDDAGLAASNMVTTESKYNLLKENIDLLVKKQDEIKILKSQQASSNLKTLLLWQLLSTGVIALIAIGISLANLLMFTRFIKKTKFDIDIVAKGDFSHRIIAVSGDELGDLAKSIEELRQSIHTLLLELKPSIESLDEAAIKLQEVSIELTNDSQTVSDGTQVIARAETDVNELATSLTAEAEQVSAGTMTLSTSLDEIKRSISEIAQNCVSEATMAEQTATTVSHVNDNMNSLENASNEIGSILKLMNDIAGKTRLLSLNATIEAVTAGEAGKGFAIVAAEVKDLAAQSTSSAAQIQQKVKAIQTQVTKAISGVTSIAESTNQFASISRTNSAAVEEQSAMMNEISNSVQRASQSATALASGIEEMAKKSNETNHAISDINKVVKSTSNDAIKTKENATRLKEIATNLRNSVSKFTI